MLFINNLGLPEGFPYTPRQFTGANNITGICVYGYLREEDDEHGPAGSFYYIGEGGASRPLGPHRVRVPDPKFIVIFTDDLNKDKGWDIEKQLIAHYGRICDESGILENILVSHVDWKNNGIFYALNTVTGQKGWIPVDHEGRETREWVGARIGQSITYNIVKCRYCDFETLTPNIHAHERACINNPNAVGGTALGMVSAINIETGERTSIPKDIFDNSDTWRGIHAGATYSKVACQYCEKEISENVLERHEKQCSHNPNRVPSKQKGIKRPHQEKAVIAPDGTRYRTLLVAESVTGIKNYTIRAMCNDIDSDWRWDPNNKVVKPPSRPSRCRKVVSPSGVVYDSIKDAQPDSGFTYRQLQSVLKKGTQGWQFA